MTSSGVRAFDHTVQTSMQWLKEVQDELHTDDEQKAYAALRATLFALRDRLTVEEGANLAAQLPMLLRGLFYEGWRPSRLPEKMKRQEFLRAVRDNIGPGGNVNDLDKDPERAVRGVFQVLYRRVSMGEMADVIGILPDDLKDLWPSRQYKAA